MLEYLWLGLSTLLIGFVPLAEIYVAVPSGIAMGLSPLSAIVWGVIGNFLPVPLIQLFYAQLLRVPRLGTWIAARATSDLKERIDRKGAWFILVMTPWTGVWIMAAVAQIFGMNKLKILWSTLASIVIYAVVTAFLVVKGIDIYSS